MNTHLMIDFETLGQAQDAVVLSLGAVVFNREKILTQQLWMFDLTSQTKARRSITMDTIVWWFGQGAAAKAVIEKSHKEGVHLDKFSEEFVKVLRDNTDVSKLKVWANGANFDIPIIEHILVSNKVAVPWLFWNSRCYRTMKSMFGIEKEMKRAGTKHDALDDAIFQASCVMSYLKKNPAADY